MKYTCSNCGGVFDNGHEDDSKARTEALDLWGTMEGMAIICDECFKTFMEWVERNGGPGKVRRV